MDTHIEKKVSVFYGMPTENIGKWTMTCSVLIMPHMNCMDPLKITLTAKLPITTTLPPLAIA
jgi:hypothetical protein